MAVEFDEYAASYHSLLDDPIRTGFAGGREFFAVRKWQVLKAFLNRRGLATQEQRWLDVGCGFGDLLRLGRSSFGEVCGCDISPEMLSGAQGLEVRLQHVPDRIPYETDAFDLVTAVCLYHHVPDREMRARLTSEIARALKPRGIFCLIEHNPLNPVTRLIVRRTPVDAKARLLHVSESTAILRASKFSVIGKEWFLYVPRKWYRRFASVESCLRTVPLGGQYAVFAEK